LRSPGIRAGELLASLSLATDLGTDQPLEHALRTCVLAVRLAEAAGVAGTQEGDDAYYLSLLHSIGCTSDAFEAAQLYGDDLATRSGYATIDAGRPAEIAGFLWRRTGDGVGAAAHLGRFGASLVAGPRRARRGLTAHCEVGRRLATRLGVSPGVVAGLDYVFERFDGRGFPRGAAGADIPLAARLLHVARDGALFARLEGAAAAKAILEERAGGAYDPALVDHCRRDHAFEGLFDDSLWDDALAAEPAGTPRLSGERLDRACQVIADFADLKSPYTLGHSEEVAELAEAAARRLGMPEDEVAALRRAALVHDLGRVAISNRVWDKPGALSAAEWERVRLHPYFTERSLARSEGLAEMGRTGAMDHECLDGSGYPRGLKAPAIPVVARLLAAADRYQAMREPRPHRGALEASVAADQLRADAAAGRVDGEAADAVLAAAGQRGGPSRRVLPAGLTAREVEVLRLVARGASNKQAAAALGLSPKTVGHHVGHIYAKIGVATRAAAALFAVENDLLRE
jgi:HD-GYP domain-containing protein (c-di-GMP phosphodiesterase class II)